MASHIECQFKKNSLLFSDFAGWVSSYSNQPAAREASMEKRAWRSDIQHAMLYIVENTLLRTAFSTIFPVGLLLKFYLIPWP